MYCESDLKNDYVVVLDDNKLKSEGLATEHSKSSLI